MTRGRARGGAVAVLVATLAVAILVAILVAALGAGLAVPAGPAAAGGRDVGPFAGLGAWVDAYDYAPGFQAVGAPPAVTPETVDDLAALGVDTLYLQAAMDDRRAGPLLVDRRLVGRFLARAHDADVQVVAWYLPTFGDPAADLRRVRALHELEVDGERFDGLALDLEWTQAVPDARARNRRLVRLAGRVRELVGDEPLGAIVFPAVQLEVLNPVLWPDFPYRRLDESFDVWMPMAYWTFRDGDYRSAFTYTDESIRRLRRNLGDPEAAVHPIGGIGDESGPADYAGFVRAARHQHAVGWSIYDVNTTATSAWARLRG